VRYLDVIGSYLRHLRTRAEARAGGDVVRVELVGGKLARWQLLRAADTVTPPMNATGGDDASDPKAGGHSDSTRA